MNGHPTQLREKLLASYLHVASLYFICMALLLLVGDGLLWGEVMMSLGYTPKFVWPGISVLGGLAVFGLCQMFPAQRRRVGYLLLGLCLPLLLVGAIYRGLAPVIFTLPVILPLLMLLPAARLALPSVLSLLVLVAALLMFSPDSSNDLVWVVLGGASTIVWPMLTLTGGVDEAWNLRRFRVVQHLMLSVCFVETATWLWFDISDLTIFAPALIAAAFYGWVSRAGKIDSGMELVIVIIPAICALLIAILDGSWMVYKTPYMVLWVVILLRPLHALVYLTVFLVLLMLNVDLSHPLLVRAMVAALGFTAVLFALLPILRSGSEEMPFSVGTREALWGFIAAVAVTVLSDGPDLLHPQGLALRPEWISVQILRFMTVGWATSVLLAINRQAREGEARALAAALEAERVARRADEESRRSLDLQRQVFSVVGYELQTPVAALTMLLNDADLGDVQKVGEAKGLARSISAIVGDLSFIAAPERALNAALEVANPSEELEKLSNYLRQLLREHGMRLDIQLHADQHRAFKAQAFRQVVTNLVKNAAHHSAGSLVRIELTRTSQGSLSRYHLVIEDDGKGLDEAAIARFELPLLDALAAETGTGIGSYVVRRFTEALGGELTCGRSELGGARFELRFDVEPADMALSRGERFAPDAKPLAGKRILLVEDSALLMNLSRRLLQRAGAVVQMATNGERALTVLEKDTPDLILTDIMMPEMDGFQLVRAARAQGFEGPIVGITSAILGLEAEELVAAGANMCLAKPLTLEKLVEALDELEAGAARPH